MAEGLGEYDARLMGRMVGAGLEPLFRVEANNVVGVGLGEGVSGTSPNPWGSRHVAARGGRCGHGSKRGGGVLMFSCLHR